MLVLGIILIILAALWGMYANPYWKNLDEGDKYANGFMRALIGIPAWGALICLMIEQWEGLSGCLVITAVLMLPAAIKLIKGKYHVLKVLFYMLGASMGVYSRILMAWTLIGIPINRKFQDLAENGWKVESELTWEAMKRNYEKRQQYEREHADEIALSEALDEASEASWKNKMAQEREYRRRVAVENGRDWFEDPETGREIRWDSVEEKWK